MCNSLLLQPMEFSFDFRSLFVFSCFTESQYDMLFGATAAIVCWFIPGIILRKKYLAQKKANV